MLDQEVKTGVLREYADGCKKSVGSIKNNILIFFIFEVFEMIDEIQNINLSLDTFE